MKPESTEDAELWEVPGSSSSPTSVVIQVSAAFATILFVLVYSNE